MILSEHLDAVGFLGEIHEDGVSGKSDRCDVWKMLVGLIFYIPVAIPIVGDTHGVIAATEEGGLEIVIMSCGH